MKDAARIFSTKPDYHPSCHRRAITCGWALDTAVEPEDNALNQLFCPIGGINYQGLGTQNSTLYS